VFSGFWELRLKPRIPENRVEGKEVLTTPHCRKRRFPETAVNNKDKIVLKDVGQ
jgi:hypothetical protein